MEDKKNASQRSADLYAECDRQAAIVKDRTRPAEERLKALHWIDKYVVGCKPTSVEDLEKVTDGMIKEGE